MSKFNSYGERVNDIAKQAFKEYQDAEAAYNKAAEQARAYPMRGGVYNAEYAAKSARAKADLIEATEARHKAQMNLQNRKNDIAAIRKELAAELTDHYCADPTKLDGHTVELLKSGVLNPSEYLILMRRAQADNNNTMERLIGKYAADAAEAESAKNGQDSKTAQSLRNVSYMANTKTGADELANFDVLVECYNRTADNTGMIENWDELTHGALARL